MAFLGINQFRRVGLRFVCWFYVGNTQRLTESGFIEKPGIEPATPGLHDIGFSLHHGGFFKLNISCALLVLRLYIGDIKTELQAPVVKPIRNLINIYFYVGRGCIILTEKGATRRLTRSFVARKYKVWIKTLTKFRPLATLYTSV